MFWERGTPGHRSVYLLDGIVATIICYRVPSAHRTVEAAYIVSLELVFDLDAPPNEITLLLQSKHRTVRSN